MAITAKRDMNYGFSVWLSRLLQRNDGITERQHASNVVMSTSSLLNKNAAVINAIAITTALAVLSGYVPMQPLSFSNLQATLQSQWSSSQK